MKAKVVETCAGRNFKAQAGDIVTSDAYELDEQHSFMKETDIQSIVNAGYAVLISKKNPAK